MYDRVPFLRNEWPRADYLTRHGKFVILSEELAYDPEVSDGLLGLETIIHGIYDTLAEAQAELALYADNDCDGHIEMHIYRLPPVPPAPAVPDFDDTLPF